MNFRNIDLNLLYLFTIVYEYKSITQAADHLCLSQPAVSNALARLNQSLNQVLFIKKNRRIVSTRLADDLYSNIKPNLFQIESAITQLNTFNQKTSHRTFNLATCNCGDMLPFPNIIPYVQKNAPNVKINQIPLSDNDLNRQLLSKNLDLILYTDFPAEKDIIKEHLFVDSMVLITGYQHPPLPNRLSTVDLIKLDLVGHAIDFEQNSPLLTQLNQHNKYCCSQLNIERIWSIVNTVATSKHAAVIPAFFAKKVSNIMPLNIHHLDNGIGAMNLYLYWRKIDDNDLGHQWLIKTVKHIFFSEEEEKDKELTASI